MVEKGTGKLLYNLYYEQVQAASEHTGVRTVDLLDLAFNDGILQDVRQEWKSILGEETDLAFMVFEDRAGIDADDDNGNDVY